MSFPFRATMAITLSLAACRPVPVDDTGSEDTGSDDTGVDDTGTDTGTDTDTGADTDTAIAATDCHTLPAGLPDWAGDIDPALVSPAPYASVATGLADLVDAIVALPSNTTNTPDTLVNPITVTGAYVLTTGFKPQSATNEVNFWVADENDVAYVRLATAASVVVKAGDQVTFTATKGQNYAGDIQVSELSSFTVTSSDNDVYVHESTDATLGAADFFWVHHVYGELVSAGTACGGSSTCFDFQHGGESGPVDVLRLQNGNLTTPLVQGDCIEIYAPADQYSGDLNFDLTDFDWFRWYGNTGG